MKIMFVFYPLFVKFNNGIAQLSSILKNKGITVTLSIAETVEQFKMDLENSKPDYVGFSFVIEQEYINSIPFIKLAKQLGYKVLAGGVYCRREKINNTDIDYICPGEAENLADFLLYGDTSLFDVPMACKDISSLPMLDYSLFRDIDIWYKRDYPFFKNQRVIPYYTSRGCPYQCSFCAVQYQPEPVRIKSNCIPELEYLKSNFNPDAFMFGDTLLPYYNESWREQFKNFFHPFFAYIRADITESQFMFLRKIGLVATAFGIESGNEEYRNNELNKELTDKDIMRTVKLCVETKIDFVPFYMQGTPGETEKIKNDTLKMHSVTGGIVWRYDRLDNNPRRKCNQREECLSYSI